ncbi:CSC1-like protein At1g69450 [Carica papaya]|uniref:CSC1-like protein At1g69450 n=1 Tax=Carica papaya TaxID=3649 RepID=UPI000B8CC5E5|nr:CSC1-like protein At1g69450 [Carica papaya]
MLVSALLTSVGINSGLCVLFFILYSVLRKQPSNYKVYIPRLLAEGNSKRRSHFNLERLIPSPDWLRKAWSLSEDDLLSSTGLDAVVFMRIITFSLKVFLFAGIIGIFVLLPVNCTGGQLHEIDFKDLSNNSLDVFTISNVKSGSKRLWIHFSAVYLLTGFVCCLLYYVRTMFSGPERGSLRWGTMKLNSSIDGIQLLFSLDLVQTHNFIGLDFLKTLKIIMVKTTGYRVVMGTGVTVKEWRYVVK